MKSDILSETLQNTDNSLDDMKTCYSTSDTKTYGLLQQAVTKMNEPVSISDTSNVGASEKKNTM